MNIRWIRYREGVPTEGDFANSSGAPIVIDTDTGKAYFLINGDLYEIQLTPVTP